MTSSSDFPFLYCISARQTSMHDLWNELAQSCSRLRQVSAVWSLSHSRQPSTIWKCSLYTSSTGLPAFLLLSIFSLYMRIILSMQPERRSAIFCPSIWAIWQSLYCLFMDMHSSHFAYAWYVSLNYNNVSSTDSITPSTTFTLSTLKMFPMLKITALSVWMQQPLHRLRLFLALILTLKLYSFLFSSLHLKTVFTKEVTMMNFYLPSISLPAYTLFKPKIISTLIYLDSVLCQQLSLIAWYRSWMGSRRQASLVGSLDSLNALATMLQYS